MFFHIYSNVNFLIVFKVDLFIELCKMINIYVNIMLNILNQIQIHVIKIYLAKTVMTFAFLRISWRSFVKYFRSLLMARIYSIRIVMFIFLPNLYPAWLAQLFNLFFAIYLLLYHFYELFIYISLHLRCVQITN